MNERKFTSVAGALPLSHAMHGFGTELELHVWPKPEHGPAAMAALQREVGELRRAERLLSRFQADSDISRINRAAGQPVRVAPLTLAIVQDALAAARASGGLFDPTIGAALIAAGYDRSFELLAARAQPEFVAAAPAGSFDAVEVDVSAATVKASAGRSLDLGGIAKGWLAGRSVRRLRPFGRVLIDLGGDIAFSAPAARSHWAIEVANPFVNDEAVGVLHCRTAGGVATSGVLRRSWTVGSATRHHIIDPRTGQPAQSDLVAVTVAAPSPAAAEIAAKAAIILGRTAATLALQRSRGLAGVFVAADRTVTFVRGPSAERWVCWQPHEKVHQ